MSDMANDLKEVIFLAWTVWVDSLFHTQVRISVRRTLLLTFWRLKAKNRSLKTHYVIFSESALILSLDYLCSYLDQSVITVPNIRPYISFHTASKRLFYGSRHTPLLSAYFFPRKFATHIYIERELRHFRFSLLDVFK